MDSPASALLTRPEDDRETPSLDHSIKDGCAHAVMLGAGEAYLSPFAIALGAGSLFVALLSSVPPFLGSLVQVASVPLLKRLRRRKDLIVRAATAQGLCWLPLVVLVLTEPSFALAALLVLTTAYFMFGSFVGPAWNSWMGDLVKPEARGRYFGRRNRLISVFQFIALVCAGLFLEGFTRLGMERLGYGALFLAALAARALSVLHLRKMEEASYSPPGPEQDFTFWEFLRRSPRSNFARFVWYVALIQFCANLAGPFFALYMLRDLHLSYAQFTAAAAAVVLVQYLTMHNWGRVTDRFGNMRVLRLTGLLIPFVPMVWLFSTRFGWILACQIFAGFIWGGFNLAATNFVFDAVTPAKRARCVAYYTLLVQGGILLGALLGGWLASRLPERLSLLTVEWHPAHSLQMLFLLSGLLRLVVSAAFLRAIREVRFVEPARTRDLVFEIVALRAIPGLKFSIFQGHHPSEREGGNTAEGGSKM